MAKPLPSAATRASRSVSSSSMRVSSSAAMGVSTGGPLAVGSVSILTLSDGVNAGICARAGTRHGMCVHEYCSMII